MKISTVIVTLAVCAGIGIVAGGVLTGLSAHDKWLPGPIIPVLPPCTMMYGLIGGGLVLWIINQVQKSRTETTPPHSEPIN